MPSVYKNFKYNVQNDLQAYIDFSIYRDDFNNGRLTGLGVDTIRILVRNMPGYDVINVTAIANNNNLYTYRHSETWNKPAENNVVLACITYSITGHQDFTADLAWLNVNNWRVPFTINSRDNDTAVFDNYLNGLENTATSYLQFNDNNISISGLNLSSKYVNQPITVYPIPALNGINNQYEIKIYSDVLVYSYKGNSPTQIPAGTFRTGITYRVDAKLNTVLGDGTTIISNASTFNISGFEVPTPSVDNLLQNGNYWEQPISVNCRADNYTSLEWELYQNNIKIGNTITTVVPNITIAAETFTQKDNCSVRVRGVNTYAGTTVYSNWQEINLRLQDIVPTLDNLALSGSNVDLPLTLSWLSTNQQAYESEIKKDATVAKTYSGTIASSIPIPASTLVAGTYTFRVRVAYKTRWSDWKEITVTLIETLPSIGVLEPDGVQVPRDNPTRIWWTSNNQSKYKLVIDGTQNYTGTTTKEINIPPATFTVGDHEMELTIWYVTPSGVEKIIQQPKKAKFKVVGNPYLPSITSPNTFTTSRPLFTWDSNEQEAYTLRLLKTDTVLYETDWKNGLINQYQVHNYIPDGTYTLQLKIKNLYELESEWSNQQITIACVHETPKVLTGTAIDNAVLLRWDGSGLFYVMRNDVVIAKTSIGEYTDYSAWNDNYYYVKSISSNDVATDSNKIYIKPDIKHGVISSVNNLSNVNNVGLTRNGWSFGGTINIENETIQLAGRELPVMIFGEHRNGSYTLSFTEEKIFNFLELCKQRQTLLYRDKYQKLYITVPNPSYALDEFGIGYDVQATEVDYMEAIDYD